MVLCRSTLQVELTITPDFQWDEKVHGTSEVSGGGGGGVHMHVACTCLLLAGILDHGGGC